MSATMTPITDVSEAERREAAIASIAAMHQMNLATPSDINELLPVLVQFGSECKHITEFGVRDAVSTVAWAHCHPDYLVLYDWHVSAYARKVWGLANLAGVRCVLNQMDTRYIVTEDTDLLFIDTLHTEDQLYMELGNNAKNVRKYIVLHDTTTFGEYGETPGSRGLNHAIADFLANNRYWRKEYETTRNNGLTILKRTTTPENPA